MPQRPPRQRLSSNAPVCHDTPFELLEPIRLIRINVTRLPLTVSELPKMLKGLWGDSNRNTECVASALRILTKKGENGWG
jgi:hypothetical protein